MQKLLSESSIQYGILLTAVHHRIGSLLIAYRATERTINEMSQIKWYDPESSHDANKQTMKELGGAVFSYRKFLTDMMIVGIAKSNEDLFLDIYEVCGRKFDIWKTTKSLRFLDEMRVIRHLNNVIKHSLGIITDNGSSSNRALIDVYGFQPNTQIEWVDIDIPIKLGEAYGFQMDLVEKETASPSTMSKISGTEILSRIEPWLVPDILKFEGPAPRETER